MFMLHLQRILASINLTRDFGNKLNNLKYVKGWKIVHVSRFWEVGVPLLFNSTVTDGKALASSKLTTLARHLYRFFMYHERRVPVNGGQWGSEEENKAAFTELWNVGRICEEVSVTCNAHSYLTAPGAPLSRPPLHHKPPMDVGQPTHPRAPCRT